MPAVLLLEFTSVETFSRDAASRGPGTCYMAVFFAGGLGDVIFTFLTTLRA
jgi:hypothetical protein